MNKEDIKKYLQMLGHELQQKQVMGEILLVGGAVMVLKVENREVTKDIGNYFDPKQSSAIREAVQVIARREGLVDDWLNDGVKGFFYTQPPNRMWVEYPGLRVYIASLEYILVMKVVAGRSQDIEDAKALIRKLQITTAQEVFSLMEKYTQKQKVEPRVQYIVEDIFDS